MKVFFHKSFEKQYQKLPAKIKSKFSQRLMLLMDSQDHPLLRVYELKGAKKPLLSMNVTADYRALFTYENNTFVFYETGTHSELY